MKKWQIGRFLLLISTCIVISIYLYWTQSNETHYNILKVSSLASTEEIAASYRSLSLKYHPDKTKRLDEIAREEATKTFHKIAVAYEILSRSDSRHAYDLILQDQMKNNPPLSYYLLIKLQMWIWMVISWYISLSFSSRFGIGIGFFAIGYTYLLQPILRRFGGRQLINRIPLSNQDKQIELQEARLRLQHEYNKQIQLRKRSREPR